MKPLNIVILGGTGFVGSRLVPRLHADGHSITVLSRNREKHRELGVLPRVRVISADVYNGEVLRRHLAGADAAINLVGILNERGSDGSGFRKVHVELTRNLLAEGLVDVLQFGLHPALWGSGQRPFDETDRFRLRLIEAEAFDSGVVLLRYAPA